ncbi:MAG: Flp pilus assembly complex ATPase component TadA, partial [Magnetococcales bacterium]|nr:Flp pilus assembly complex ATPase component TadA [Magnetococcales bacterium]
METPSPSGVRRPKLGDMLVEAHIISAEQLKQALDYQHEQDVKLGEALIALKFLTAQELSDFLGNQRKTLMMGDLLVKAGKITFQQLQETLKEQKRSGTRFGEALVNLGYLTELGFAQFFAKHIGVTCLDLSTITVEDSAVKMMEEEAIRRLRALPIKRAGGGVLVGMVDPSDLLAYDEVTQALRRPVEVALILEKQMRQVLDRVFRKTGEIQGLMQELGEEMNRNRLDLNQFVKTEMVQDAPVVKILQTLFEDAIRQNASDIHIEPGQHVLRIRKRIDGVLHEQIIREKSVSIPLLSKLKLMAGLEISERRLSQGGRFSLKVGDADVDIRLSTLPTENGESAVLR